MKLILTLAVGVVIGCALSDLATIRGFPHVKYLVQLTHEASRKGDFLCMKRGGIYGTNLSERNPVAGVQENCLILLTGEIQADGSVDAYLGNMTWYWRMRNAFSPRNIPASDIISVRRSDLTL